MKWWFGFFYCFFAITAFSCEVIDDTDRKIILPHVATRIVSLAPDLTENLFEIGAGSKIVGVVKGSDYPISAKKIRIIGSYDHIDQEAILSLHPDLIVAWADSRFVSLLKKLGVPFYLSKPTKIIDIPYTLERLGCLTGNSNAAKKSAVAFQKRYAILKNKHTHKKNLTLFYQIWFNPLMTVTQKSWIHDAITLCGAQNIFANLRGVAPTVNLEAVIEANPEIILANDDDTLFKKHWEPWKRIRAVKNQNLYTIPSDLIERASIRVLDGVERICEIVSHASELGSFGVVK